jgi:hypothetical protein
LQRLAFNFSKTTNTLPIETECWPVVNLALAAADWCVVERDLTATTRLAAAFQAITASLQHFTAGSITAGARNATSVFGKFTLANAHGQATFTNCDSVASAYATAGPFAEHFAKIL